MFVLQRGSDKDRETRQSIAFFGWSANPHSEVLCTQQGGSSSRVYGAEGRDRYEADGIKSIFGDYDIYEKWLIHRYEDWLPAFLAAENAEQRTILKINEDAVAFLVNLFEQTHTLPPGKAVTQRKSGFLRSCGACADQYCAIGSKG